MRYYELGYGEKEIVAAFVKQEIEELNQGAGG